MLKIFFFSCTLFCCLCSFAQNDQIMLKEVLNSFNQEVPKLERRFHMKIFEGISNSEFKNYHFIIIPMFTLKVNYMDYTVGENFIKYIDFSKMLDDFIALVLKDTVYDGILHTSDCDNSYIPAYQGHHQFAKQILNFEPDMVFYADCTEYIFLIKGDKLFVGKETKQFQTLEFILSFNDFVKKYPLFVCDIQNNKFPEVRKYIKLR